MLNIKGIIAVLLMLVSYNGAWGLLGCLLTCPVGANVTGLDDTCSNGDSAACSKGCGGLFGGALCGGGCVDRGNGKSECVCELDCAFAGEWGDPHYWTFDMFMYSFQGLCKHTVLKQCKKSKSFPNFEVRFKNAPWIPGAPTSGVSNIEVIVSDWKTTYEISAGDGLIVNGDKQPTNSSMRHSSINSKGVENYIRFTSNLLEHSITTSFGLKIIAQKLASYDVYMWTFVMIPAHPELRGNTCGMLGNWDDNPTNDIKDPDGKQSVADPAFSWLYGQSWCVSKDENFFDVAEQTKRTAKLAQNIKLCDVSVDTAKDTISNPLGAVEKAGKAVDSRVRKSCKKLLDPSFKDCKFVLWAATSLESCVMDMCSMTDEKDQDQYMCLMLKTMNKFCNTTVETC